MTNKKWWIWVLSIIIILLLVLIPFIINIAYLKGVDLKEANTAFSSSDLLSLYGTILGALATILAVIFTIKYERQQQILGAKPIIQTESNLISFKDDIDQLPHIDKYLIYPFNNEEQVGSCIKFESNYIYKKDYTNFINEEEYLVFSYSISNAGLGGAVGVDLKVNELVSTPKFFVANNEYKTFIFIVNKTKANSTIKLTFEYTDIYDKYTYIQTEQMHIYMNKDNKLLYRQELKDLISKPQIL